MKSTRTDSRGMNRTLALALAAGTSMTLMALAPSPALAGPKGERVVRGQVDIARDGALTTIKASNKAIINFDSFNVAQGETVRFVQPGRNARVLNRITGPGPSEIDGALIANGRVYIVNPAGVIFGANSVVNASGLVAAGASLSDRDFLSGVDRFTNVTGPVVTEGLITAEAVHLVGSRVENAGTIVADYGVVSMMVGSDVLIRERGGTIMVRIDENAPAAAPRTSLGAGDAASLAIRNTGSVSAPGGTIAVNAPSGSVVNSGTMSAGVDSGAAGRIAVNAAQIVNSGEISADAGAGLAGAVEVVSTQRTALEAGSRVSASGGDGLASGGEVLVHSIGGDTSMAPGATVAVSGGRSGGDGGFAEVSATNRLEVHGTLEGNALPGFAGATLLLDPFNIIIASPGPEDGQLGDGKILQTDGGPADTWQVSPASIEGFNGDVRLEANNDILVLESINKTNGGLTLLAGRDILFGPDMGDAVFDLNISAFTLDFSARRDIVDNVLLTTSLSTTVGDMSLRAEAGAIGHGVLSVPAGRTIFLTQADSLFVGAGPFGFVANPEQTNLSINVTQGFLVLGGDFGGVSGNQAVQNIEAMAAEYIEIQDDLAIGNSASFMSFGDVIVGGDVIANGSVEFHSGLDGTGNVYFPELGTNIEGLSIVLAAGNGPGGASGASVDAITNGPTFAGPGGPGSLPAAFTIAQDATITDATVPLVGQFGGSVDGVSYLLQSNDGAVMLSSDKVKNSALTLSSLTGSMIDTDLQARSLVVKGPAFISANITTTSLQRFEGAVTLLLDVTLTASDISFLSTVDGPGGLTDNGPTSFAGAVGGTEALRFITLNGPGALNGALVRTAGNQTYNGPLTLGANSVLRSLSGGILALNAPLDGAFDLSLITTPDGLIRFNAPVGQTTALRDLSLSTAGEAPSRGIPAAATIVGAGDQTFRVRDFVMGQNEKMTVLGSLDLGASRQALLGDTTTMGDLLVAAPTIVLNRRQPGVLDTIDGPVTDRGLDFVAGASLTFNGSVFLGGDDSAPNPTFGTGDDRVQGIDRNLYEVRRQPAADTTVEALVVDGQVLDQRTRAGSTPIPPDDNPAEVNDDIAGAAQPVNPEFKDTVTPEAYRVDLLNRIALLGRGVSDTEAADAMIGPALFNDLAEAPALSGPALATAATRLHRPAVESAVARFDAVFGPEGEDRSAEVRDLLASTAGRYMSLTQAASVDPGAFRAWLATSDGSPDALATIANLSDLLARLRSLGLTAPEYSQARDRILAVIAPQGMTVETLAALLESDSIARADATPEPRG